MKVDFEAEPPLFPVTATHKVASWLLDPRAPKVEMPEVLQRRLNELRKEHGL